MAYNQYDSDYQVRLATLGALGGDTGKTYDSVYDVDIAILEAIEQGGGGGGMTYNQMKELLAASGVTEILFSDESGHTVTLDYELVSQIGQGGNSNYLIVNSLDELSGITAEEGMFAYVKAHTAQEERLVVVTDFYDYEYNENKLYINIEWNDSNSARINQWYGGNNIQINEGYGRFINFGGDYIDDVHNHRDKVPTNILFNNDATGTLVSNVDGANYPDRYEFVNTFWFDKFDGEYPTITFTTDESGGMVVVTTSATVETVTVTYPAKGMYRYSAAANKWLAYEVNYGALSSAETNQIFTDYLQYRNEVYIVKPYKSSEEPYQNIKMKLISIGSFYEENQVAYFSSELYGSENGSDDRPSVYYWRWFRDMDGHTGWNAENLYKSELVKWAYYENGTNQKINRKIGTVSTNDVNFGESYGGLYNVSIDGTFSGTVYSTTFSADTGATNFNNIYRYQNRKSEKGVDVYNRKDGILDNDGINFIPTVNTGWTVVDYSYSWNDTESRYEKNFIAVRYIDNQDDTITVDVFVSDANMHQEDDHYDTDFYNFWCRGNDDGYSWTVTTGQTATVERKLYGLDSFIRINQDNNQEMRTKLYDIETGVSMYDGSKKKIRIMTESAYESLGVKDNNVIYYLTED